MHVLTQVDAVRCKVGKQFLERADLLGHGMAAIVDEDVDSGDPLSERSEKSSVFLVADDDLNLAFLGILAVRVDVHSYDSGARAKVVFPHLQ